MDLIDDPAPGQNAPEFTVSEISGAVKRLLEGEFGRVRIRGEVGRTLLARSGHLYFDLKDDRAVISAVSWKGQVARMRVRPEEGMEVVAVGRLTTYPGQSKYQLIVDEIAPAGVGALMAMLEKRKAQLAAEGLFDAARKRPIPYLPTVIGVVTSPQGAVIRDILHRLRDRFPRRVLVWPVVVQGERCAPDVARAIAGFNALDPAGPIPRPDLLIVARGGGSLEDLWGFNEEIVARAAAASKIPLISAVGHETDTTLIDFASDQRAPTPTAAAELAVPVRLELLAGVAGLGARLSRAAVQGITQRRQRLRDLARALPRPEDLVTRQAQRLDGLAVRLQTALGFRVERARTRLDGFGRRLNPDHLGRGVSRHRVLMEDRARRLATALPRVARQARQDLGRLGGRLTPASLDRCLSRERDRFGVVSARLSRAARTRQDRLTQRLASLTRMHRSLGYTQTLKRGYAVLWDENDKVLTTVAKASEAVGLVIELADGRFKPNGSGTPRAPRQKPDPEDQGSLF